MFLNKEHYWLCQLVFKPKIYFMKNLFTLLSLALCLVFANNTYAVVAPINSTSSEVVAETAPISKKELRKQAKLNKKLAKAEKKMADGPFDDEVTKWRNFWILGWGLGLLLNIIRLIGPSGGFFSGTTFVGFGIFWVR